MTGRPGVSRRAVGRRAFLVAGSALMATACGPAESEPGSAQRTAPATKSQAPSPSKPQTAPTPSTPTPTLPAVQAWSPADGEIQPEVKLAATRVIEALGTVVVDGPAADRLADIEAGPGLAEQAGALVPPAAPATAEIVYPQYGGLTSSAASVMTVVEQTWLASGREQRRTVTADVRLTRTGRGWLVTELRPVEPIEAAELTLSGPADTLADNPRVTLPNAAVADLAGGVVDPLVIDALFRLSESHEMSVSVFRSGHPENVFGTDGVSNHTRGRAVDIWAIDAVPVVTMSTDDATLLSFLAAARQLDSDEIGGPVDPDGPGGAHFANDLHRDHVHLGFDG